MRFPKNLTTVIKGGPASPKNNGKNNILPPKTNMDTQNRRHVWSRRYIFQTIIFGIYKYVSFLGGIFLESRKKSTFFLAPVWKPPLPHSILGETNCSTGDSLVANQESHQPRKINKQKQLIYPKLFTKTSIFFWHLVSGNQDPFVCKTSPDAAPTFCWWPVFGIFSALTRSFTPE